MQQYRQEGGPIPSFWTEGSVRKEPPHSPTKNQQGGLVRTKPPPPHARLGMGSPDPHPRQGWGPPIHRTGGIAIGIRGRYISECKVSQTDILCFLVWTWINLTVYMYHSNYTVGSPPDIAGFGEER